MLAVSHFRNTTTTAAAAKDDRVVSDMESFTIGDFADFSGENLVDSIDFDDLFVGIDMDDGDLLPDLEMDPEILAEFSVSSGDESDFNNYSTTTPLLTFEEEGSSFIRNGDVQKGSSILNQESEIVSLNYDAAASVNLMPKEISDKSKKSSGNSKSSQGKRKVKVDWTPELHRRFVQAVEQLGVDKAVPSRILELMGIDCLTRHNIASHLQKYRCHRRHLLAREAEAASWNQRGQMYGGAAGGGGGGGGKRDMNLWLAPTMGFPPPPPPPMAHFRPLHVWGHPHVWPKHMSPSPSSPPVWPPAPPPAGPSFWNPHYQRVPNALTPGAPCFPAPTRFPALPVPGIPSSAMYKVGPGIGVPATPSGAGQPLPKPPCDFHPSKESVDADIGDVLSNPWQPQPLGLKPPSVDGVLVELQRQGITKIPPSTCA